MSDPGGYPPAGWRSPGAWPAKIGFYLRTRAEQLRRLCYAAIHEFQFRGKARFTVLWDHPPVIYASHLGVERLMPLPRGSLVLIMLQHTHEDPEVRGRTVSIIRRHFPASSGVRTLILTNTMREAELLAADGMDAEFLSHNALLDERVFIIRPEVPKRHDAIYDAQVLPYKRHYLAAEIASLALIAYTHRPSPERAYMKGIRRLLSGADWINDPLDGHYRLLEPSAVCAAYNASRVGLCLSEIEGAMYASCQYLMCGLPVVSTPNIGGRDVFLEPDFSATVEPTPEAVAAGVRSLVARRVDPQEIRRRTVERMLSMRRRFVAIAQEHIDRSGTKADFAAHFERVFFHTLLKHRRVAREKPREP